MMLAPEPEELEVAWLDGRFGPFTEALISIAAHVVHYATSVFEGIKAYDDRMQPGHVNVWLLYEHLRRLRRSAEAYGLDYPWTDDELARFILQVVSRNAGHTYLRPVIFRNVGSTGKGLGVNPRLVNVSTALMTALWGKYVNDFYHNDGASVLVWDKLLRPPASMFPGQAKGGPGYGVWSQQAKEAANVAEASEALLCAKDEATGEQFIVDGSGMNLYIVKDGVVITPDPERWNILSGLTMWFLLEQTIGDDRVEALHGDINLELLLQADEVGLTGTATEVTPVTLVKYRTPGGQLAKFEIGDGKAGPVTKKLAAVLDRAAHGQSPAYRKFLTPVPQLTRV